MVRKALWPTLQRWYLYFLLYSVLGWLYELFREEEVNRWGFTNRGVLFGPYCPVYGVGALTFLLCFRPLMARQAPRWLRLLRPLLLFLGCMAVATAIELATSYILETLTGSWPWQTYTDYAIHFQGRIALSPSLRFGLGGVFFLYILQPIFQRLVNALHDRWRQTIALLAAGGMLLDCLCTLLLRR